MTRTQTPAQLRRLSDLSTICRAISRVRPTTTASIGLLDVANACRIHGVGGWTTRDNFLIIACDWDIACDRLDDQSDACLAAIARVLRV